MDLLSITREATALAALIGVGTNLYVCWQASRINRRAGKVLAASAYPLLAAVTCAAIFVGRLHGVLVQEPGWHTTDISGPIVAGIALYAGWQSTSRLADIIEGQDASELIARVIADETEYQGKHPDVHVDPLQEDEDGPAPLH